MTWLLDTNVCVNYLRSGVGSPIAEHLAERNPEDVVLCSVVRAELVFGAIKSRDAAANLIKVGKFTARFLSLPFDDDAAEAYGRIRAALEAQGRTIGPNDLVDCVDRQGPKPHVGDAQHGRVPPRAGAEIEDWEAA